VCSSTEIRKERELSREIASRALVVHRVCILLRTAKEMRTNTSTEVTETLKNTRFLHEWCQDSHHHPIARRSAFGIAIAATGWVMVLSSSHIDLTASEDSRMPLPAPGWIFKIWYR
jgi:hypothetical protein